MLWPYPTASEAFMVAVNVCNQPCVNVYRNETQSFMGSETELLFPTYIVPVLQLWITYYVCTLQCMLRWFAFGHKFYIFMVVLSMP